MILIKGNVEREAHDLLVIDKLKEAGYTPLEGTEAPEDTKLPELEDLSVKELQTLAKGKGIQGASNLKKSELIELLSKDEGGENNGSPDNGTGTENPDKSENPDEGK